MSSQPSRSRDRLRAGLFLAALLIPLWTAFAAADPPRLVADLNTQPVSGSALPYPNGFDKPPRAELGRILYFAANDPMHGQELWRSDGTLEGTWLVRDIRPGRQGSDLKNLTAHQGRLYFFADDGVWGLELWSSDGTREGTRLVRDICPGACPVTYHDRNFLTSAGSQLFFGADAGYQDLDLWRTDGTREGTRRVVDPCPGCSASFHEGVTPLPDGRVLFVGYEPETGEELWVSDGTPAGTRVLDVIPGPQGLGPVNRIALGNRLLFWTYVFPGQYRLWVSDGTVAGTRVVREGLTGPGFPNVPVVWKGAVYFVSNFGEFWRTDGTPEGTIHLKTFGALQIAPYYTPSYPTRLTPLRNDLLFIAADPARGLALWRTRGTPETTRPLRDPIPGPESPDLTGLQSVGNRAFFFTRREEGPFELWVSNGSTAGTRQVITLCHSAGECFSPDRFDLLGAGGLAFFSMYSKIVGGELWRSDGSAQGTFRVRDIRSGPGSAIVRDEIAALDGHALFAVQTASPGTAPATLWSSDGTAAGTTLLEGEATWPQDFLRHGDRLFFSGASPWTPSEPLRLRRQGLWRTDGTPGGTELVMGDIFDLDLLAFDGDILYLGAKDQKSIEEGTGFEPWRSDGTPEGTRQVADIDQQLAENFGSPPIPEPGSSDPGPPVRLGPILLFAADDGLSGRELWATDGTEAGTRQVRNINQESTDCCGNVLQEWSSPEFLVRLGGVVLFAADDGVTGRELWMTDGTEAGTRRLRDLRPGAEGSSPHDLVELGGKVYFFASAGGPGEALWRTDGTAAGTVQVRSLSRQGLPSWGRTLTRAGNRLFFVADNEAIGSELHVSDGTQAGTRLVRQIRAGANGSYPQSFTVVNGVLLFAADDGTHGLEPWRSDGTAAGTRRLGDLAPGPAASAPSAFTAAGEHLFFAADDGAHGRELWTMELP